MRIRAYQTKDLPRLKELFNMQGFDYSFPDIDTDQFPVRQVVVDENDEVQMAILARHTCELYMLHNTDWKTPAWRWFSLMQIHNAVKERLAERGFKDAHVWLPPQVCESFGRRLKRYLGWRDNPWTCLSRGTGE